MKTYRVRKGIIYFRTLGKALEFAELHGFPFPCHRLMPYTLGLPGTHWAIQLRRGGDYLGPDGRPSEESRGK